MSVDVKHTKNIVLKMVTFSIPALMLILVCMRNTLIKIASYFPECYFYKATGLLCPACGNTRSVKYLLRGEYICSVKYNVTPVLLLILGAIFYTELVFYTAGRKVIIFPRSYKFLGTLLSVLILYYLLRNFFSLPS